MIITIIKLIQYSFITFGACYHLNFKHSVFGRVVGGHETLSKMESVQTDKEDRPKEDVIIHKVTVFVNPFKEIETEEQKKIRLEEQSKKEKEEVLI